MNDALLYHAFVTLCPADPDPDPGFSSSSSRRRIDDDDDVIHPFIHPPLSKDPLLCFYNSLCTCKKLKYQKMHNTSKSY
jgi:hypothetical protein